MSSSQVHHSKARRRKISLRRRLLVAGLAVFAAALQILLANIPRTIDLPQNDVDAQTFARADNERIEIDEPNLPEGAVVFSYAGQAGEVADLHFDDAIVDASNAGPQPSLKSVRPVPAKIAYATMAAEGAKPGPAPALPGGDTCHTSIEIRRAMGSSPITSIHAFLVNGTANNEQRRELRGWADGGTLDVSIHTDPPPGADLSQIGAIPGCSKVLQLRPLEGSDSPASADIRLDKPMVRLVVPNVPGQKPSDPANAFRIRLTPASDTHLTWLSADDFISGITLGKTASGKTSLEAMQVRVLPLREDHGERLKARAEGNSKLVLDRLAFSLNTLKLRVSGPASVEINGKRMGFDFMRFLKENPILSGVLGLLNAAILLLVKETFFPRVEDQPEEGE